MIRALLSYLFGAAAFFVLALVCVWACLIALDAEADNREARQFQQDKRLLLKAPAMFKIKGRVVEDCQIVADELHCIYYTRQGELKMMAAK